MIDFTAHVPQELQAKYRALSDDELLTAAKTLLPGADKDAADAELFRRYREERSKIPIEERRRQSAERFRLKLEDITIIDK